MLHHKLPVHRRRKGMFCFWNRPGWRDRHMHIYMSIYIYNPMDNMYNICVCIACHSLGNLTTVREIKRLFSELLAPWKLGHVKLVGYHYQGFRSILQNLNQIVLNDDFGIALAKNMYFVNPLLMFSCTPSCSSPQSACPVVGIMWRTWVSPSCYKIFFFSFP